MLKTFCMHLLLLGWTIVIHYYQAVLKAPGKPSKCCGKSTNRALNTRKKNHISPLLASLRWLLVKATIEFLKKLIVHS